MKSQFEIKDRTIIDDILANAEYGTLALCSDNIPYSVPINFVQVEGSIYFHGAKKGKKMGFIRDNPIASFSVVEPYSMIQSYFSSTEGMACPATHFFKSVSCYGDIKIVDSYDEKVLALESLMKKLQPEGRYKSLDHDAYKKVVDVTEVFKLIPSELKGKVKLGQHLPKERFDMIIEHLEKRGSEIDKLTVKDMLEIEDD